MGGKWQSEPPQPMSSPTSVFVIPEKMPEIQPIVLPDSWTLVGKRGKPVVQEGKMYDEPHVAKKTKKKRRSRPRKEETPEAMWALENMPSSSKCFHKVAVDVASKGKQVAQGRLARYWRRHRLAKAAKVHAHKSLLAYMMHDDEIEAP